MNFNQLWRFILLLALGGSTICSAEVLRYHTLVLDSQNKIIPWSTPTANAFDNYLDKCWSWALAAPNDTNGLPISFLYCAWSPGNPPAASTSWENDVGEKIPNWVESARLYYQYSGNKAPLNYVQRLVDYSLDHGQTPANHAWPNFPVGTANAGDTEFRGFTDLWALWDCHVDLAADIGFSMFRMYQMYGDTKYRDKAIHVADVLVSHMVTGNATDSPWPYVINSQTGANHSRYAASWDGALQLFDLLIENNQGSVSSYMSARTRLKDWLLTYPMQNGNWVDGHSDIKPAVGMETAYWSTTCGSDMCLYLLDHPGWDTNFMTDVPKLLKWAEDNFVNVSTLDQLPGQYYGAYVPAEQIAFMYRMGYQAARLGAQYAQWYEVSGDATYKDKAYRCLSYNTYMMQDNGQSSDGPTDGVGYWWSDCYGEAPRMYYYALGAVPEWAPPDENHLLRSSSVVTSVTYATNAIQYTIFDDGSTETLRLTFTPAHVFVDGAALPQRSDLNQPGWVFTAANGVLRIRHDTGSQVQIVAGSPTIKLNSIAVTPANPTILSGVSQPFTATGTYSDGSVQNLTSQVTWTSSNRGVATINATGQATGISAGTTTISATLTGVTGSTGLTVQSVPLAIGTTFLPNGVVNVAYTATLTADGGTLPYTWSVAGGSLPPDLTLNPSNGVITGAPTATGTFSFTVQVRDAGNPVQTATQSLSLVIALVSEPTGVTIWPSTAAPELVDSGPDSAVELGVKFKSDVAGTITGIRFYKATANTGDHVGSLWTSTGTLLATAIFTNETASGWQQILFATPVAIASNTIYVASYHANGGHYSTDLNYFLTGVDHPPLHALANGVSGGNGIYAYGASSVFPNQTYNAANYWVDVVFQAGPPPTLMSLMVTPASPSIPGGVTQQFTATGIYSDGSTQNVTSQATWTSSNVGVVTINAAGQVVGVSVGTTTISATLASVVGATMLTVQSAPLVVTIWSNTTAPTVVDGGPDSAVELGVKFQSDVAGIISGIRFYKATANTGAHVGNLWTSNGTLLATATFSNETASGWQQALFATPVTIASNTVYVASYHIEEGHYSVDFNYFSGKGVDNPPLHALINGVSGGNGVYAYGVSSTFPNQSYNAANYWVDVVFQAMSPQTLTSITVTPANPSIITGALQQFVATGTYSDGSTQNLTSQATWTSSNPGVATINASGLATGVSGGTTTISATLAGVTGNSTLTVKALPTLISIAVIPANPTILIGASQQFTATGIYSDGTQDLTSQATWTSSNPGMAAINAGGLATGISTGATTVSATLAGVVGFTTLTIQSTPLVITATSLPNTVTNVAYSRTLTAAGGTAPYTWSIAGGSLPPGLTLTGGGIITGTPTTTGTFSFTAQVRDTGNPQQTATKLLDIKTVPAEVTIWPSTAAPQQTNGGLGKDIELGVKFQSDMAGTIIGVRFYKSKDNTGNHVGNLWSSTGVRLATGTFEHETASGWQQVLFPTPVTIASNTVYVVSYSTTKDRYALDNNYFLTSGVDNPPLHALANSISGGNSVYGNKNVFPTQTQNAANYWVDVVFKPTY